MFYGKTDGKRPLGRSKPRREDNNKMDLPEFRWSSIAVVQDRESVRRLRKGQ